jgi:hypothetical protein
MLLDSTPVHAHKQSLNSVCSSSMNLNILYDLLINGNIGSNKEWNYYSSFYT